MGLLATLQGASRLTSGLPTLEGARMAVDEINATGGLHAGGVRYRVVLVVRDFEDRADAAATAARELINRERVDVLVGPQFSRHAIAVAIAAEDAGVPMMSPMASNPEVTLGRRWVFRLAAPDDQQSRAIARVAREDLRATLLGCDSWDIQAIGPMPEADGAFVTHNWNPEFPGAAAQQFLTA